ANARLCGSEWLMSKPGAMRLSVLMLQRQLSQFHSGFPVTVTRLPSWHPSPSLDRESRTGRALSDALRLTGSGAPFSRTAYENVYNGRVRSTSIGGLPSRESERAYLAIRHPPAG